MTQATNTVRFVLDGKIVEAQGKRRTPPFWTICANNFSALEPRRVAQRVTVVRVW